MKGFACAVFAALLFAAALGHETGRPGPQVLEYIPLTPPPEYAFGCQAPGEGLWRFQNNFQLEGPDAPRMPAAVAEVRLVRVGNNAYNASGLLDTANGLFLDVPVSLSAFYNPATCYLTGAAFAPSTNTVDAFALWSTGTTLYGTYVVSQNSTLISPLLGVTNATLIGGF